MKLAICVGLVVLWAALSLVAILHDLRVTGDWADAPLRTRIWRSIKDVGDPQRYVHMFYGECSRPWCYCHDEAAHSTSEER